MEADRHEPEQARRVAEPILAEFPGGISIRRDYDTSLPPLTADREQIITGSVVMTCLALMMVVMNNYNPR